MRSPVAIPRRSEVIHDHRKEGGLVAAALPIHYPRALLRAFGYLPVEVWGPPQIDAAYGAAHLQPYVCSVVRNALSFLRSGGLDVADLLVVPHACDALQGLGSILLDFVRPQQPVVPIYLPRGRRESDLEFLAEELRAVYRRLCEITGLTPSEEDLLDCVRREEEADGLLEELYGRREELPMSDLAFYRLVRSREYLPAERFADLARAALSKVGEPPPDGTPILLSGIVPEPMALFEALEEMGGRVVADDLACCGRRLYPAGRSDDPFRRMAESLLSGPPDPTRGSPVEERVAHLKRVAKATGARGVVFYDVKFCEPELFDIPSLRHDLSQAGFPSVVIELDLNDPLSHQTLTRLEAFLEMVRRAAAGEGEAAGSGRRV